MKDEGRRGTMSNYSNAKKHMIRTSVIVIIIIIIIIIIITKYMQIIAK
jgi:hypothetical protein